MRLKKIFPWLLLLGLSPITDLHLWGAKMKGPAENSNLTFKYKHGDAPDFEKLSQEIDKNEKKIFRDALLKMYQDGVAHPIKKVDTYVVLGNTGVG